jgi:hypothetical protein
MVGGLHGLRDEELLRLVFFPQNGYYNSLAEGLLR